MSEVRCDKAFEQISHIETAHLLEPWNFPLLPNIEIAPTFTLIFETSRHCING